MASMQQVPVPNAGALETTITGYIARGFVVQQRGDDFAVLFKAKEFQIVWAIVGFLLCLIPLLVYLIVYALQTDQAVEIRVTAPAVQWSDDRTLWWDGVAWRSLADDGPPPGCVLSDDGRYFLDAGQWRPVPEPEIQLRRPPRSKELPE